MPAEARFTAMGSQAHVIVTGDDRLVGRARRRIDDLEARWSRFRPDSEISRLNRHPGRSIELSPQTFTLVERAVAAWGATDGRYDPTVLPALRAAGYDRDLADLRHGTAPGPEAPLPAPGCSGIRLDLGSRTVTLPPGVELDPGGIGKGLAADLVTAELLAAGGEGALVNLGGDLRVRGEPPAGDSWSVAVEHPLYPDRPLFTVGVADGGVATSSPLRRRWDLADGPRHHLIDPRTGRPADTGLAAVTVIAADAWWAEALAKSIYLTGAAAGHLVVDDALVATVDDAGHLDMTPVLVDLVA